MKKLMLNFLAFSVAAYCAAYMQKYFDIARAKACLLRRMPPIAICEVEKIGQKTECDAMIQDASRANFLRCISH